MLQGPYAETVMKRVVKGGLTKNLGRFEHGLFSILDSDVIIARTSYSGEDGFCLKFLQNLRVQSIYGST